MGDPFRPQIADTLLSAGQSWTAETPADATGYEKNPTVLVTAQADPVDHAALALNPALTALPDKLTAIKLAPWPYRGSLTLDSYYPEGALAVRTQLARFAVAAVTAQVMGRNSGGVVVQDSFTDVSATALESHTGEIGASWTINTGTAGFVISNANRCRMGAGISASKFSRTSGVVPGAEYFVESDLFVASVNDTQIGVAARIASGASTGYLGIYEATKWTLYKWVAGTFTALSSSTTETLVLNATRRLRLQCFDAVKAFYVDGVLIVPSSADNAITAAGFAGIWGFDSTPADTDTTGYHLDNFVAYGNTTPQPVMQTHAALTRSSRY